ncbi:MAG: radical SAM protein [Synergistaceae bacterium]|jgi:radical SAM superfamily enzyme with C-terminal helix-hairpin-helix motif|nr:radical SAM protein [Synergistaceae bacterium]
MNALILDGYVDEPACFGVPPYVSPYVRYCAGVLTSRGFETAYSTCDSWRRNRAETDALVADSDIVVVIMGLTVPGRYRGGSPLTLRELETIAGARRRGVLILGGPIRSGYALRGGVAARKVFPEGVDYLAYGDPEASLDLFCRNGEWLEDAPRSPRRLEEIAALGAEILKRHPSYPDVIAEIELSRGCDRVDGRCSFCAEGSSPRYEERGVEGVAREISAISSVGVGAFRLGRCSNILAWGGEPSPRGVRPNPSRLEELYSSIRASAKGLKVLHTDNCNPLTITNFPEESRACVEAIARHNTAGDGLSLGIESVDPSVIKANSLKVSFSQALSAIRLINEAGGVRKTPNSLPSLLPGLNFLYGLAGESKETLEQNRLFLTELLASDLAVRRINIRRAIVLPGSNLERALAANPSRLKERDYRRWREWVRKEADPVMLGRVAPDGTVIRDVIAEERAGNVVFGRALGSYAPLVGVVSKSLEPKDKADVMVTGRGGRSLTAVRNPLDANSCGKEELMALPGLGSARADFFIANRPYETRDGIKKALSEMDSPGIAEKLLRYFT